MVVETAIVQQAKNLKDFAVQFSFQGTIWNHPTTMYCEKDEDCFTHAFCELENRIFLIDKW